MTRIGTHFLDTTFFGFGPESFLEPPLIGSLFRYTATPEARVCIPHSSSIHVPTASPPSDSLPLFSPGSASPFGDVALAPKILVPPHSRFFPPEISFSQWPHALTAAAHFFCPGLLLAGSSPAQILWTRLMILKVLFQSCIEGPLFPL